MTPSFVRACLPLLLVLCGLRASAAGQGRELNQPPHPSARRLVERAVALAESDRPRAAITLLNKARSISPNYLRAHVKYINVKANYLGRYDDAEAEYGSLIRRFPDRPVYLLAWHFNPRGAAGRSALRRVVELAPHWTWGRYARALLIKDADPEGAASELARCIEEDGSAQEPYELLIELQERGLRRLADAIRTAEKLAARGDIRPSQRLPPLWRLRLAEARQSEGAKADLRRQLTSLENESRDVEVLLAVRSAYLNLLNDADGAEAVARRIARLDPTWTPLRGWLYTQVKSNQSGTPRLVVLVNRQIALYEKVQAVNAATELGAAERMRRLEELLGQGPSADVRRIIYESIFRLAIKSKNDSAAERYCKALRLFDPHDSALLSQTALLLADKKLRLSEALRLARMANALTSEFSPAVRPTNSPQSFQDELFPERKQREAYAVNRALALDALGWVLVRLKRAQEAEPLLRQALGQGRTESRLRHLAEALRGLGRAAEAAALEGEADVFLADSLKGKFIDEQFADLQLKPFEGRPFNLSSLKGKVVLINFWATWCVPCAAERPALQKLYRKYKGKGFEVIAASIDEDESKVRSSTARGGFDLSVMSPPELGKQLGVESVPASLFIDKRGRLRYRKTGYEEGDERELEAVIIELLK